MLERHLRSIPPRPSPESAPGETEFGLPQLLTFFRRRRFAILLAAAAGLLVGALYLVVTPAAYMATTALLIDTRKLSIFSDGDVVGEAVISNANVETQVQILLSARITEAVATKLDLTSDADFMAADADAIGTVATWLAALVSSPSNDSVAVSQADVSLLRRAAGKLRRNLAVARVGLSFVINVSYTDGDPLRAATIANAFTDAYVEDQFNAQVATAQRGSDWLLTRIQHLRDQATEEGLTAQEKSAVRATYDSFLQRYTETVQQQSLPFTEARVITPAAQGTKTSPRAALILAGSLFAGAFFGLGIAIARDILDRSIRTGRQVEAATGALFLGYLPTFKVGRRRLRQWALRSKKRDPEARRFSAGSAYSLVLTAPFSRFTETLRRIKVAVDRPTRGPVRVLGIVSSVANEGRSTIAANLARLAAQGGGRVLLIDGDLRNPTLSEELATDSALGFVQVVRREVRVSDTTWSDQFTALEFLPAGAGAKLANASEILSSAATQAFLEACRQQYDLVVVDLPAVLPVVDVSAAAHLFDGFVFVVEWAHTAEDILAEAFHVPGISERVVGAVLNKVDISLLKRFESHDADARVGKYMESYRHTA